MERVNIETCLSIEDGVISELVMGGVHIWSEVGRYVPDEALVGHGCRWSMQRGWKEADCARCFHWCGCGVAAFSAALFCGTTSMRRCP
jgi:hypothetical protein